MAKYTAGEIHFNLMALIQDRTVRYIWTTLLSEFLGGKLNHHPVACIFMIWLKFCWWRYNSQLKEVAALPADMQVPNFASEAVLRYAIQRCATLSCATLRCTALRCAALYSTATLKSLLVKIIHCYSFFITTFLGFRGCQNWNDARRWGE